LSRQVFPREVKKSVAFPLSDLGWTLSVALVVCADALLGRFTDKIAEMLAVAPSFRK
jgi:hypothetical protein